MPLSADIKINGQHISTIHVGRLEGGTDPWSINLYAAVATSEQHQENRIDWNASARFYHVYGEGAEVCVMKAIEALESRGMLP